MQRIVVVGSTGSGKTTMAGELATLLDIPHLELDSVYHRAEWTPADDDEMARVVGGFVAGDRWVVDGNYTSTSAADLVWERADTVVWLDPPRRTVMWRVVRRSVHRAATGRELWNGNREHWRNLVRLDPEENIVMWAWTRFDPTRSKYEQRSRDPRWSHVTVHRLRSNRELAAFLGEL